MIPVWFIIATIVVLLAILTFDILLAFRRPHVPPTRESAAWIIFYVTLAILFGCLLWWVTDTSIAGQFLTAWITEYSLSVDNLFIFLLIMSRFAVPQKSIQAMLMVGIILALIFRAIFIAVGIQLTENFGWIFYIFSIIMLVAAFNQAIGGEKEEEHTENRLIKLLRKKVPVTARFHGTQLTMKLNGRRLFTPALLVFATLGTTDAILALDSVPAAFAITQSTFLIIVANIFALMGLRQLYFLLGSLVRRLVFLKYGIAAILAFISVKLFITALHDNDLPFLNHGQPITIIPEIPTSMSLAIIIIVMAIAVIASLLHMRRHRSLDS
jgi:tellurite resistance protein TerC